MDGPKFKCGLGLKCSREEEDDKGCRSRLSMNEREREKKKNEPAWAEIGEKWAICFG